PRCRKTAVAFSTNHSASFDDFSTVSIKISTVATNQNTGNKNVSRYEYLYRIETLDQSILLRQDVVLVEMLIFAELVALLNNLIDHLLLGHHSRLDVGLLLQQILNRI